LSCVALTKLDNEARARQDAEGLRPPFEIRLRTAREDLNKLLPALARPSLSESPKWDSFAGPGDLYQTTEDSRQVFAGRLFTISHVDIELNELLAESNNGETQILQKGRSIQQSATRSIRIWSLVALLVGLIVGQSTIWEIQRRFRQMHRSMEETRRDRSFSNQMLQGMVSAVGGDR